MSVSPRTLPSLRPAAREPSPIPTRLTLACALAEAEEFCVCDLSWIVERSQNLVSHHVRTLRSHGLVRSRREGKMVMYSLTTAGRDLVGAVLAQKQGSRV